MVLLLASCFVSVVGNIILYLMLLVALVCTGLNDVTVL